MRADKSAFDKPQRRRHVGFWPISDIAGRNSC